MDVELLPSVLVRLNVGHDAEQLDKPLKNGRTHRWRVFVRAPDGYPAFEDRSFIKKVTFQLHATYREPKRSIRLPPFEVAETAYGCFELPITIQFKNVEKTYSINYDLTLPIEQKTVHVQFDQFLEISNPPSQKFINLVLKYGGKLKWSAADKPVNTPPVVSNEKPNEVNEKPQLKAREPLETLDSSRETDAEKHKKHKKHKKGDKPKEHKKKKDEKDKKPLDLPVKEQMPSLIAQPSILEVNVDDLFGEPSPKRDRNEGKEERSEKRSSSKSSNSSSKRPRFFVSTTTESDPVKDESKSKVASTPIKVKVESTPVNVANVLNQVNELAKAPMAPLSPIGKLKHIKNEESDDGINPHSPLFNEKQSDPLVSTKDDAYWEKFNKIRNSLSRPIDRAKYSLSFLHKLDNVNDEYVSCYERQIPLVKFDADFTSIQFTLEDNRELFENNGSSEEPQMLRLV